MTFRGAEQLRQGDLIRLKDGRAAVVVRIEHTSDVALVIHYVVAGKGLHFRVFRDETSGHYPVLEVVHLTEGGA